MVGFPPYPAPSIPSEIDSSTVTKFNPCDFKKKYLENGKWTFELGFSEGHGVTGHYRNTNVYPPHLTKKDCWAHAFGDLLHFVLGSQLQYVDTIPMPLDQRPLVYSWEHLKCPKHDTRSDARINKWCGMTQCSALRYVVGQIAGKSLNASVKLHGEWE